MKAFAIFAAVTIPFLPLQSHAQEPSAQTGAYLDTLYGMCLNAEYRSDLLINLAREMDWPEMPATVVEMSRPPAPQKYWQSWFALAPEPLPFNFVATAGISLDGVETCGASFLNADHEEFLTAFEFETNAVQQGRDDEFGGVSIYYTVPTLPNVSVSVQFQKRQPGIFVHTFHNLRQ